MHHNHIETGQDLYLDDSNILAHHMVGVLKGWQEYLIYLVSHYIMDQEMLSISVDTHDRNMSDDQTVILY